jgi:hypothetical protein
MELGEVEHGPAQDAER